ncbi:uncharacterized protein LOC128662558 [Bombina bombina]|uniref:uncharacterized protein LOC128662558 n=1 Tax=Bombina bombina TaxID=8345 RepID=UPI00235A8002|nr:uncharacterized protein LOC128662558 [Bombina bombina]XP_053572327.1 uncharacterized protein LOC128662558 [Bombina bombina]XP_053572328.1 uncharacterized protein LOC128662558 [Bombina bombina]XP_053572329.1 uncharacterized protein LOC128662558 [Bombina bombina]
MELELHENKDPDNQMATWNKTQKMGYLEASMSSGVNSMLPSRIKSKVHKIVDETRKELVKVNMSKRPSEQPISVTVSASGLVNLINTFEREGYSYVEGPFAHIVSYVCKSSDESEKIVNKFGTISEAGVGRIRVELSMMDSRSPHTSIDSTENVSGTVNVHTTKDRQHYAFAEGPFARSGFYVYESSGPEHKKIYKYGAYAEAGVGRITAEFSVFDTEARGPSASARAEASSIGVGAMARAEVGSISATAGPVHAKIGLAADTGITVGLHEFEIILLGTGFKIGQALSISILGSSISIG